MGVVVRQIVDVLNEPESKSANLEVRRVIAKDVIISYLLSFLYNHKEYRRLAFYGGTCARVVYGLDRFSEDIDLDNSMEVPIDNLSDELLLFVKNQMQLDGADIYTQKGEGGVARWVVRVPVMKELGLSANLGEKLHVKIEISNRVQGATVIKTPMVRHGQVAVITHFDEPSLMAGKMVACIERVWQKGDEGTNSVKGRDFYDLIWYMEQKVKPNPQVLLKAGNKSYTAECAWDLLSERIAKLGKKELEMDLRSFIPNGAYLSQWLDNFEGFYARLRG